MPDLPPEILGSSAWYGPKMASQTDWIETFNEVEIAEIEEAARRFSASNIDPAALRREHFPLPTLAPRLHRILDQVLNGRGFVLLRGLPVKRWSRREAACAFLGLGLHWGNLRSQNAQGHLLGHVKDQGLSSDLPSALHRIGAAFSRSTCLDRPANRNVE